MSIKEKSDEIINEVFGRKKKVHVGSGADLKDGVIRLPYKYGELSALVAFGVVRKAIAVQQAVKEYARVLKAGAPCAFRVWTGPNFSIAYFQGILEVHFEVKKSIPLLTQGKRTVVAFVCEKKE